MAHHEKKSVAELVAESATPGSEYHDAWKLGHFDRMNMGPDSPPKTMNAGRKKAWKLGYLAATQELVDRYRGGKAEP